MVNTGFYKEYKKGALSKEFVGEKW